MKRTKIIATLGPATHTKEIISDLISKGMDAVRLNFSHGTHADHADLIALVREVAQEHNRHIAIIQDLQGPKIRLGILPDAGVEVIGGQEVVFDTALNEYQDNQFPVDFKILHTFVKPGERILLNDGRVTGTITSVQDTKITVHIEHGGLLSSHKGLNVPDSQVTISPLTEKDRADAVFGISQKVDFIALSFVRQASDIQELRALITQTEGDLIPSTGIIAKMERPEAIENSAAILAATDAIMVARGDLGIEIAEAKVPIVQKQLIAAALAVNKPVIVATQMLDSMQENPLPTRAEVSDVANAEIDLADAVMLSNESATGKFPRETVAIMSDILREAEASVYDDRLPTPPEGNTDTVAQAVRQRAEESGAVIIVTASAQGRIARHLSHFRPQVPIVVVTDNERVARQLALVSGVYAVSGNLQSIDSVLTTATKYAVNNQLCMTGDTIVIALSNPLAADSEISVLETKAV